jgi:hypothetical protein
VKTRQAAAGGTGGRQFNPGADELPGAARAAWKASDSPLLKGTTMLFLLGVKAHPAVRVLIGAALIAIGLGLHMTLPAVAGIVALLWGGYTWRRRSRGGALPGRNGAAR